jgi:predicted metal-dependent enzyme (double-stranded beta helix superfamily)
VSASTADAALANLPDRELTQDELQTLVTSVAANPSAWQDKLQFEDRPDGAGRYYACLHRDGHVDVWLLCWTPGDDTGWHDHDISSGAVAVLEGCLVERNLAVGVTSVDTDVPAGQVFSFGPDHIHRLTGKAPASVSVHAYSPPLWRMGQYAVGPAGVLRRVSLSYADELRPIDEPASKTA